MIWFIIEQGVNVLESYLTAFCIIRFLGQKPEYKERLLYILLTAILFIDISIENAVMIFEGFGVSIPVCLCVIFSLVFLEGSIFEKVFISAINYIIILIINLSVLGVLSAIFHVQIEELIKSRDELRLLILFTTKFLYFIIIQAILHFRKKEKYTLDKVQWGLILVLFITSFIIGISIFEILLEFSNFKFSYFGIISIIGLILINIVAYILLIKINKNNQAKIEVALLKLTLSEQKQRALQIENQYCEIQKLRHDFKNYIGCAQSLLKVDKKLEAEEYLSRIITDKLDSITKYVSTNSEPINAVINTKLTNCKNKNINVKCEVLVNDFSGFQELDLSILLSNLFDNAIEACSKNSQKSILVLEMTDRKGYLCILMKNSLEKSVLENNPKLKTTKKDKAMHGIGLNSVRDIAEKYQGMVNFSEADDMFIVDIWLKKAKIYAN